MLMQLLCGSARQPLLPFHTNSNPLRLVFSPSVFFFLCDSHSICHGNVIAPDRGRAERMKIIRCGKKKKRKKERNSNAKRQDELRFKWSFELGVRRRSGEDARTQAMRRVSQDEAAPGRAHPRLAEMEKQA